MAFVSDLGIGKSLFKKARRRSLADGGGIIRLETESFEFRVGEEGTLGDYKILPALDDLITDCGDLCGRLSIVSGWQIGTLVNCFVSHGVAPP